MSVSMAVVALQTALKRWLPQAERATCSKLELQPNAEGFVVHAIWLASRLSPAGGCDVIFTRQRILGRTASFPPLQQKPTKRVCQFNDDIIAEVLKARGV